MKILNVLARKNGHDTPREKDKSEVKRRLNEVERQITDPNVRKADAEILGSREKGPAAL